jgi:hypothetical protein
MSRSQGTFERYDDGQQTIDLVIAAQMRGGPQWDELRRAASS